MLFCKFRSLIDGVGALTLLVVTPSVMFTICSVQMTIMLWMRPQNWFGTSMSRYMCISLLGDFFATGFPLNQIMWLVGSFLKRLRCVWRVRWSGNGATFVRFLYHFSRVMTSCSWLDWGLWAWSVWYSWPFSPCQAGQWQDIPLCNFCGYYVFGFCGLNVIIGCLKIRWLIFISL